MQPRVCAVGKEFASIKGKERIEESEERSTQNDGLKQRKKHNLEKKQQE